MKLTSKLVSLLFGLVLLYPAADTLYAQFATKWLHVGEFAHIYSEASALYEIDTIGLTWPVEYVSPVTSDASRHQAIWVGVEGFTDQTGKTWSAKIAHVGVRNPGGGEVNPQLHETINKFEPVAVTVDGFNSFNKVNWPVEPNVRVDANLPADRAIHTIANYVTGIEVEINAYAWGNEYHDSYQIQEYVFTNTGNVDEDPEPELSARLDRVWFYFNTRYAPGGGRNNSGTGGWTTGGGQNWGNATMQDATWEGNPNYNVDFRSVFTWMGRSDGQSAWNSIGAPVIESVSPWGAASDTVGRLSAAFMVGKVVLHADAQAHAPGVQAADDPAQPFTILHVDADQTLQSNNSHLNEAQSLREMNEIIKAGRVQPTHARAVVPDGNFANQPTDPSAPAGSSTVGDGYGPYSMAIGDQVKIVHAVAAAGLNPDIALEVGRAYKRGGRNDAAPIPYTIHGQEVRLTKNQWVLTSRDSLFQEFQKAMANYRAGYAIPQPPLPPKSFSVTGEGNRILLEWEVYDNANHVGFELYRSPDRVDRQRAPDPEAAYQLIATFGPEVRSFADVTAVRGTNYYYYIQSVGPVNSDGTAMTPTGVPLKSNRFYTQTYDPATLKRPAGTLSSVRVVPNPYVINQQESLVRFLEQDRIAFYDLPAQCTLRIFTETGELVKTIEHTNNTGDEFWNLTTDANQVVVSGIYLLHVRDNANNGTVVRKFVIVR